MTYTVATQPRIQSSTSLCCSYLYCSCHLPLAQNNHFRITAFNRFQAVIQFLRKELNFKPTDSLVGLSHIVSRRKTLRINLTYQSYLILDEPLAVPVYQRFLQPSARRYRWELVQSKSHFTCLSLYLQVDVVLTDMLTSHVRRRTVFWNRKPSHSQLQHNSRLGLAQQ